MFIAYYPNLNLSDVFTYYTNLNYKSTVAGNKIYCLELFALFQVWEGH